MTQREEDKAFLAQYPAMSEYQQLKAEFYEDRVGVARVFTNAVRVECFRFSGPSKALFSDRCRTHDIAAHTPQSTQDRRFALRPASFMSGCEFDPTVEFRVHSANDFVSVVICFSCDLFMILENDPDVPLCSVGGQKGRVRIGGGTGVMADQLYWLAQEALCAP